MKTITKRIIALMLSLVMAFAVFAFNVSAEDELQRESEGINLSVSEQVKLGKDFEATVSLSNNTGERVYGCEFKLSYDSENLELKEIKVNTADECPWISETLYDKNGSLYITAFADLINVSDVSKAGVSPDDVIDIVIVFKAKEVGSYTLSATNAILLKGEFLEDHDVNSEASANFDISYPAKVSGAYLSLGSGIHLVFSALIPEEYEGAQMCFSQDLVTADGVVAETPATVNGTKTTATGSYNGVTLPKYEFAKGINPARLGDEVYAYVVYDGVVISEQKSYSVIKYCNHLFTYGKSMTPGYTDEQYNTFITLLCDLLAYGDASQIYTSYNTSSLVSSLVIENFALKPTVFQSVTESDFSLAEGQISDPKFSGVSLLLGSTFKISYKVKATSLEGLKIKVSFSKDEKNYYYYTDGSSLVPSETEGTYYLNVKPDATGIDFVYTVTIYDKDGNEGRTVTYSVKSYVYTMQNDTSSLGGLVKALYNYGKSVEVFAAATK